MCMWRERLLSKDNSIAVICVRGMPMPAQRARAVYRLIFRLHNPDLLLSFLLPRARPPDQGPSCAPALAHDLAARATYVS